MWHNCLFFFNSFIVLKNIITQIICDEAVDDSLAALSLMPEFFVVKYND